MKIRAIRAGEIMLTRRSVIVQNALETGKKKKAKFKFQVNVSAMQGARVYTLGTNEEKEFKEWLLVCAIFNSSVQV